MECMGTWHTKENFSLKYKNEKPHTRIIWDVDWLPLEYGNALVTGSEIEQLNCGYSMRSLVIIKW